VRVLWAARAIEAGFDCEGWSRRACSTSGEDAQRGRFDRSSVSLTASLGEGREAVFTRAANALLLYQVFPPWRMRYRVCTGDGRVARGATIVQRVRLGLVALETAVRVVDVFEWAPPGERKCGFSYATLEGHPERGIATFYVRQDSLTGVVDLVIETWSRPGTWATRMGRPVARLLQRHLTSEALRYFQALVVAPGSLSL